MLHPGLISPERMIKLPVVAEGPNQLNTPRLPRNFQYDLEISVRVDGGVEWKDEYTMGWCGLLAKGQIHIAK
jgi:hypothetical protein